MERHLWLNLADIREKGKNFPLDAPVSPTDLFDIFVEKVFGKLREERAHLAAFRKYIPHPRTGGRA